MAAIGRLAARARNIAGQPNVVAAAKAWEGSNVTCPSWCRDKFSEYHNPRAGYATKPRGLLGFLGKDGLFQSRDQRPPAPANDYGVDTRERDDDSEDEPGRFQRPDQKLDKQLMSVLPEDPSKGKAVSETALDNIGGILTKTGLEVELDVSLQELSIEKLVLKDLGLVLVIKTKPAQPQPGPPPSPEPQPQRPQ